jgi:hypothetical protein
LIEIQKNNRAIKITMLFAIAPFFAYIALDENASILSVDARGSRLRLQVGNARPPSVALTDLPRGEHRSAAAPRAATTSMQLFDSRRAPAFDVE